VAPDKNLSREARVQSSIQSALDGVFGSGAAIVRVSLRTSGEERSMQSTRVIPRGPLEADEGSERGREGAKNFERQRSRTRYAYDTVVDTKSSHPDALEHIAVAVFLNAHKVSLAQSKLVVGLVRAAAGADLQRGDDVVVQALPFTVKPLGGGPPRHVRLRVLAAASVVFCTLVTLTGYLLPFARQKLRARSREAAVALHATLENELPQTAAYVLGTIPPRVREQVLREYSVEQRERILRHLNGRAHG
jgi:flagellar biosynthesis/type III secretory pathway M-ring protein FliF/YscJ